MFKWFKRPQRQPESARVAAMVEESVQVAKLGESVVTEALEAADEVLRAWLPLSGEGQVPPEVGFGLRMEMLFFLLHAADRYAFEKSKSPAVRDTFIDRLAEDTITVLVQVSFDSSNVDPGLDPAEWERKMVASALGDLNEVQVEYGSCESLYGDGSPESALGDRTVVGRLAARIVEAISPNDSALAMPTCVAAMRSVVNAQLADGVAKACSAIGSAAP